MSNIHPTAIIEPGAKLGEGVQIGPFCTVGKDVELGANTRLISHVVVTGHTVMGTGNTVYPFTSLGLPSPDLKYKGEHATLVIGNDNVIRESITMHIGTGAGGGETRVGNNNLLMPGTHVAHDCVVGNNTIIANYVQLAGHVNIADNVTIGGLTGIHQHVRIGTHAIVGGHTAVDHDVPPFASVSGRRAVLKGLNLVGLRRRGFDNALIRKLSDAYDLLFDITDEDLPLLERARLLKQETKLPEVVALADFVLATQRGMTGYDDE